MSIQYTVLRFKPTTFRLQVSSYNHSTRAPTLWKNIFHIEKSNKLLFKILQALIRAQADADNNDDDADDDGSKV